MKEYKIIAGEQQKEFNNLKNQILNSKEKISLNKEILDLIKFLQKLQKKTILSWE